MRTLQINPERLGLGYFLQDSAGGFGQDDAKRHSKPGTKWKSGFKACCDRLGHDFWKLNSFDRMICFSRFASISATKGV